MILVFDIGNTNIVFGTMQDRKFVKSFRLQSDTKKTVDEYAMYLLYLMEINGLDYNNLDAVMISSVVPQLTSIIKAVATKYIDAPCYVVSSDSNHGLKIMLDNPSELGNDRLMSALAAYSKYAADCITVDFGTANTLEVVTCKGEFLGGTIFPGVKLALNSLHLNTAKLPMVDIAKPGRVVGKNTVESIQSGIYYGYLSMVDGMIDRTLSELFSGRGDIKILGTGGLGGYFAPESRHNMIYEADLVCYGIYCLYERIKNS